MAKILLHSAVFCRQVKLTELFFDRGMETSRCKVTRVFFDLFPCGLCRLYRLKNRTALLLTNDYSGRTRRTSLDLKKIWMTQSVKDTAKVCVSNWNIGHKYCTDILFKILFIEALVAALPQWSVQFAVQFLSFICNLQPAASDTTGPVYNYNLGKHAFENSKAVFLCR